MGSAVFDLSLRSRIARLVENKKLQDENCKPNVGYPPILVKLDGGDHDFAGVDTNGRSGSVGLVALHTINMNDPFLAIHLCNLSFPTLVLSAYNPYFVILANW